MGGTGQDEGGHRLKLVGRVLFGADEHVARWVAKRIEGMTVSPGAKALGVAIDERIVAGVVYEQFNGVHCTVSIAAVPGSGWADRRTLAALFGYPFEQLDCTAISVTIPMSNLPSLNLATGLGFKPEAIIAFAAPDGGPLVVLKMFKDTCRWLGYGQGKQGTGTARSAEDGSG
jgi:hypothetical protein